MAARPRPGRGQRKAAEPFAHQRRVPNVVENKKKPLGLAIAKQLRAEQFRPLNPGSSPRRIHHAPQKSSSLFGRPSGSKTIVSETLWWYTAFN